MPHFTASPIYTTSFCVTHPIATIIVVTYNSARWLRRQTRALAEQTDARWRLTIFDNASRPDERPPLATLPAGSSLMQSEVNLGFAEANNIAARHADTPYLVFLNPDAFPEPDWLARLVETAELHPAVGAIGSTQIRESGHGVFDGTGDVMHATGLAYRSSYGRLRSAAPVLGETFSACAAAMLVRREAFEDAGGFDPIYFCFFEDVDLCFRLRLRGWGILQSPEARVSHVGGGAAGTRNPFSDFHGARNRTWTFVKCMPPALLWPILPLHAVAASLAATWALMSGRGLAAWRGLAAAVKGIAPIWRARRLVQAKRTASLIDIARALAWSPHVLLGRDPVLRAIRRPFCREAPTRQ